MSDLGAIFHVKKDGVQYDAHAYTTLDECPEPNIKIKFKGQQAYVKMENKGSGDVPCYAKGAEGVYQVKKEAVPTGSLSVRSNITFTVPAGVKVIEVAPRYYLKTYVGVTPNSVHKLIWKVIYGDSTDTHQLVCSSHRRIKWGEDKDSQDITLSWSPEINKKPTDVTDY